MKKMVKAVVISAIVISLVYLEGSFIAMDLNPKSWGAGGRVSASILALGFSFLGAWAVVEEVI